MRKRIIALFSALSLLAAENISLNATAAYISAIENNESIAESAQNDENIVPQTTIATEAVTTQATETTTVTVVPEEPKDEKELALAELERKGNILFGEFKRAKAVILGELNADAARLTLDEVKQIIQESADFSEINEKLTGIYPDYVGGSGVTVTEYWFDDKGIEKVYFINEEESIFYIVYDENSKAVDSELLYPVENEMQFTPNAVMMLQSYHVYNDINEEVNPIVTTTATTTTVSSQTVPTETTTVTTVTEEPKDEKELALAELERKGNVLFGEFKRAKAVILGELNADVARLTLDEMKQIIQESADFSEINKKLAGIYPDYVGGSGVTVTEYWFDDKGTEKITIIQEEETIFYIELDADGKVVKWNILYPDEMEVKFESYSTTLKRSFMVYNDIENTSTSGDENSRITSIQVQDIIAKNDTFDGIYQEIQAIHGNPDKSYGSGLSLEEYWLDDDGNEYIFIQKEEKKIYLRGDDKNELLYNGFESLPQTGYSNLYKVLAGIASSMTVTGTAMIARSKKKDEE